MNTTNRSTSSANALVKVRALLVEDDSVDALLLAEAFAVPEGFSIELVRTTCLADALVELAAPSTTTPSSAAPAYDIVILDLNLPDGAGLDNIGRICELAPTLPILVLTGYHDTDNALAALRLGAQDYLVRGKWDTTQLERSIRYAIERNRVERELRASETQLSNLLDSLTDAVWRVSADSGETFYMSPATERIYGRPIEDFYRNPALWCGVVHPDDHALIDVYWQELARRGRVTLEYRILRPDGSLRWVLDRAQALRDGAGRLVAFEGLTSDITDRKRAEQALRDSEQKVRDLLEQATSGLAALEDAERFSRTVVASVQQGIAVYDRDLVHLVWNDYMEGLSGMSSAEVVGRPVYDVFPDMDTSGFQALIERALAGETVALKAHPIAVRGRPGWIDATYSPLLDGDGNVAGGIVVVTDVTERVESERTLRESEARYRELLGVTRAGEAQLRAVIDNATDAIYIKDQQGRYLQANPVVTGVLRQPLDRIIGRTNREILSHEDATALDAYDDAVLSSGEPITFERFASLPDGGRHFLTSKFPFRIGDDTLGVASISRDISERKRAEQHEVDRRRVLEMVIRNEPMAQTLTELIGTIERRYPAGVISFSVVRDGALVHAAPRGPGDGFLEALDDPFPPGEGAVGRAFSTGEPLQFDDLPDLPSRPEDRRRLFAEHGVRAVWLWPVMSAEGEPLGMLALRFGEERETTAADENFLAAMRQLAAVVVEHSRLLEQLTYQAKHDALTGLMNRFEFEARLDRAVTEAERIGRRVALLFIDLDRFKHINDTLGHQLGDRMLEEAAERLRHCTRGRAVLARMGGDEFALLIPDLHDVEDATHTARNLLKTIEAPFSIDGHELFITASIGISLFPDDAQDAVTLLSNVDRAMYQAKEHGKNNFYSFLPRLNAEARERLELENGLRRAAERDELLLVYQPKVDVGTGRTVGFEALIRWRHGQRGTIPPSEFIPLAEESGLIVPIGEWVLREACCQAAAWQQAGREPLGVSVNVSALQFTRLDFYDIVVDALDVSGLPPTLLDLEVTESVVMNGIEQVARRLDRLRELGVSISIDDFGTGYSSMAYLKRLPADVIKIDKSFIDDVGGEGKGARGSSALIEAVVTLAQGLDMEVLAEGVETRAQLSFLKRIGCNLAQGFLFSLPLPASEVWPVTRLSR